MSQPRRPQLQWKPRQLTEEDEKEEVDIKATKAVAVAAVAAAAAATKSQPLLVHWRKGCGIS